ncbi:MAG: S8 family serine peptidase [Chloroflexi bacterium]|nr:S8 family serine peptidase [Chloroflexota bacterium]
MRKLYQFHRRAVGLMLLAFTLLAFGFDSTSVAAQDQPLPTSQEQMRLDMLRAQGIEVPARQLRQPTDLWAVEVAPGTDVNALAAQLGFENLGPIQGLPGVYNFRQVGSASRTAEVANTLAVDGRVMAFAHQLMNLNESRQVPDPLYPNQWHLNNTGQNGGTPGEDANVVAAWNAGYNGTGTVIAIVDDGLERTHPDLSPNYTAAGSYDYFSFDPDPMPGSGDFHGTSVGGVAGARDNGSCGVGAAYRAQISGIRYGFTDTQEASSLSHQLQLNQIYNNSWGPSDNGFVLAGPGPLTAQVLQNGVINGRGGLGNIFVWAAGNGLGTNDNMNADGYANSRYTIAVAATDDRGEQASYSEPGAAILINAPSSSVGRQGVTTTDRAGFTGYSTTDCTSTFGGTSSSSPLVAGIVALMLDANPNLTWRDVQHILVNTAERNDPTDGDWEQNGAGRWYSHKYGFGRVNAGAAVTAAVGFPSTGTPQTFANPVVNVNQPIPDNNFTGVTANTTFNAPAGFVVEHVEVIFNATHTWRGDIAVTLTSPSGTQSRLMEVRPDNGDNFTNWSFGSVNFWGENPNGTWTIRVTDLLQDFSGTFNSFQLIVHGYTPSAQPQGGGNDTLGLYVPSTALWLMRNSNTSGDAQTSFVYGGLQGGVPLAGDWNGDGIDTAGMYVPNLAYWFMRNSNTTGNGDVFAVYGGIPGALPIVGDWNGNGTDTVGLYNPATGQWLLRNSNTSGDADISFVFGGIPGALPIAGDWNGDGVDTIGLYNPTTALWILRNSNSSGNPDVTLVYGGIAGGLPVVGDWNNNGTDTVGMYVPNLAYWFMRNTNTTGNGDVFAVYGGITGALPVVGDWDNAALITAGADVAASPVLDAAQFTQPAQPNAAAPLSVSPELPFSVAPAVPAAPLSGPQQPSDVAPGGELPDGLFGG